MTFAAGRIERQAHQGSCRTEQIWLYRMSPSPLKKVSHPRTLLELHSILVAGRLVKRDVHVDNVTSVMVFREPKTGREGE